MPFKKVSQRVNRTHMRLLSIQRADFYPRANDPTFPTRRREPLRLAREALSEAAELLGKACEKYDEMDAAMDEMNEVVIGEGMKAHTLNFHQARKEAKEFVALAEGKLDLAEEYFKEVAALK